MRLHEVNGLEPGTPVILKDGSQARFQSISIENSGPRVIVSFAHGGGMLMPAKRIRGIDPNPPVWETSAEINGLTRTKHVHHGFGLSGPNGAITLSTRTRQGETHQPVARNGTEANAAQCRLTGAPCLNLSMTPKAVRNTIWEWEDAGRTDDAMFAVLEREWGTLLRGSHPMIAGGGARL